MALRRLAPHEPAPTVDASLAAVKERLGGLAADLDSLERETAGTADDLARIATDLRSLKTQVEPRQPHARLRPVGGDDPQLPTAS
jgi:hypothetical protein